MSMMEREGISPPPKIQISLADVEKQRTYKRAMEVQEIEVCDSDKPSSSKMSDSVASPMSSKKRHKFYQQKGIQSQDVIVMKNLTLKKRALNIANKDKRHSIMILNNMINDKESFFSKEEEEKMYDTILEDDHEEENENFRINRIEEALQKNAL